MRDKPVTIALTGNTTYLKVKKASLDKIEKGSFIGTATKDVGGTQVALEVVIFPPSMRGAGEGHYVWDKIPDTTLSGGAKTSSSMTNGNVSAVSTSVPTVNSTMTNGDVAASRAQGGVTHLVVTYNGGQQDVLVPPTTPIVTYLPGTKALVAKGKDVFIKATDTGSGLAANVVAVGVDGVQAADVTGTPAPEAREPSTARRNIRYETTCNTPPGASGRDPHHALGRGLRHGLHDLQRLGNL